jgi:Ca-activated chloride channel family protein
MRLIFLPLLILIFLARRAEPQAREPFHISVSVDLVVLHPVVHDTRGRFATDLTERDFAVYENGVRQTIKLFRHEDIPVTVGLVVDHSGSMKPKLADVVAAAGTFVASSRPEDQIFVVNFNEKVTLGLPNAIRLGDSSAMIEHAISGTPTTGKTALYDAATEAFGQLKAGGPAKKVLIVISDGGDNASAHKLTDVLKTAEESSALVYTIGIFDDDDADKNPEVLTRLARATGGESFFPRRRDDVEAICQSIARDIRNQYTIGYVSSNPAKTGDWRSIRLTAAATGHGKLVVRTRSGYIAGAASGSESR